MNSFFIPRLGRKKRKLLKDQVLVNRYFVGGSARNRATREAARRIEKDSWGSIAINNARGKIGFGSRMLKRPFSTVVQKRLEAENKRIDKIYPERGKKKKQNR